MAQYLGDGIYKVGKAQQLWSVRQAKLADAMPPVQGVPADSAFGWLRGPAFPTPAEPGCYVVEFLASGDIRLLAYVDGYGRAFTTQEIIDRPPAREEDLCLAISEVDPNEGGIYVRDPDGEVRKVASCVKHGSGTNAKYSIVDSGFAFGQMGQNLHYFDLMARAYLAFVYRPQFEGTAHAISLDDVYRRLGSESLGPALIDIVRGIRAAQTDQTLVVPPMLSLLADWLEAAGALTLTDQRAAMENMQLIRTGSYANIFYLNERSESDPALPEAKKWALEGALNRFRNLHLALVERSAIANEELCLKTDGAFLSSFATQQGDYRMPDDVPQGKPGSEWHIRCRIAAGVENMILPYRVEAPFRYDHKTGHVTFRMRVPSPAVFAPLIPASVEEGAPSSSDHAARMAQVYAMQAGLFLASMAFGAAGSINAVRLVAHPISDRVDTLPIPDGVDELIALGDEESAASTMDAESKAPWFDVVFTREDCVATNGFAEGRGGNPTGTYLRAEANEPYPLDEALPYPLCWEQMADLAGLVAPLPNDVQGALCARTRDDLRIEYAADRRIIAETIADGLAQCTTTSEAIKKVKEVQASLPPTDDGSTREEAFNRLMESLAEGSVAPTDREAIIVEFIGPDPCREAHTRAQDLTEAGEPERAAEILAKAVSEAYMDSYTDTDTVIHRVFDSYWSRLVYNLQRAGKIDAPADVLADHGKKVKLASDFLYFSLLDLINILEDSFDRSDEAIRYGQMAITLAPTTGIAYRLLGRAYMLSGDLTNAAETLQRGLTVMQSFEDIALAYYQLAYVLWKAGKPEEAMLCYGKSIVTSPVMAEAASVELRELQEEAHISIPEAGNIDESLEQAGIVVAPLKPLAKYFMEAAIAATDEGLYPAARNILAASTNYDRDDGVIAVLRSFSDLD